MLTENMQSVTNRSRTANPWNTGSVFGSAAGDARRHLLSVANNVWLCGLLSVAVGSAFAAIHLQTGWFPHDEGQLGQAAERALAGEVPHRDFDDMYTGGLTYLNALAFKLWGIRSESIRWMMWCWFIPTLAGFYWLATRFSAPSQAGLITFLAAAITLPVNSPALPSWYNLFLMLLGAACLWQYQDSRNRWWIFSAGLLAGLSIVIKITGLYFLAAALMICLHDELLAAAGPGDHRQQFLSAGSNSWLKPYRVLVSAGLLAFCGMVLLFSMTTDWLMASLHLTLPVWGLCIYLGWRLWYCQPGWPENRLRRLLQRAGPLVAGTLLPVGIWVVWYALAGGLAELGEGVFVLPRQRLGGASQPFPEWPWFFCGALPTLLLAACSLWRHGDPTPRGMAPAYRMLAIAATAFALRVCRGSAELVNAIWFPDVAADHSQCASLAGAVGQPDPFWTHTDQNNAFRSRQVIPAVGSDEPRLSGSIPLCQ